MLPLLVLVRVLPIITNTFIAESFAKLIPDINAPDTSEHHYWTEFDHRFFSKICRS